MQPVGAKPSVVSASPLPEVERAATGSVPPSESNGGVLPRGVREPAVRSVLPAPGDAQPAARPTLAIDSFRVMTDTLISGLPEAERPALLRGLEADVERVVAGALPANLEAIPRERTALVVSALRRTANEAADALMQLPQDNRGARLVGMRRLDTLVNNAMEVIAAREGVPADGMRQWLAREHGLAFNVALTTHAEDGEGTADIRAGIADLAPRSREIQRANLLVEVTPRPDLVDQRARDAVQRLFPGVQPPMVYATADASFTWLGANDSQVPMVSEANLRSSLPGASESDVRTRLLATAANELGHASFDRATGGRTDAFGWLHPDPGTAFTRGYELISDAVSSQLAPRPLDAMLDTQDARYSVSRQVARDFLTSRGVVIDSPDARFARINGTYQQWLDAECQKAGTTYAQLNDDFRASVLTTARGYLERSGIGAR